MPVWTPGEYRVQNHARFVRNLAADNGGGLTVTRPDASSWQVTPRSDAPVTVSYDLPNTPPGLFTENVHVTDRAAFYNGPATLLYVAGRASEPVSLRVTPPPGWKGAVTPLPVGSDGTFAAPDYDTLADSPILVGERVERDFEVFDRRHRLAFFGRHRGADYDGLSDVLRRVAVASNRYMGSTPYQQYVLFVDMGGRGGGLEHANSARVAAPSDAAAGSMAQFIAHEYFHLWNVKRIRPSVLGPFDYTRPARTPNLWFAEGVTDYVAGQLTLRAGLSSEDELLDSLAHSIAAWEANARRRRVAPDEASRRIWEGQWGSAYGGVSIYSSGEMIGLCLDLKLLHLTDGRTGLREVFRDLMERHAPPKPGYGDDGIRDAFIRAGGAAMGPYYDSLARTTAPMPFDECLRYIGLARTAKDAGKPSLTEVQRASPAERRLRGIWLRGK